MKYPRGDSNPQHDIALEATAYTDSATGASVCISILVLWDRERLPPPKPISVASSGSRKTSPTGVPQAFHNGTLGGDRTPGLEIRSLPLCPLSYEGNG